MLRITPQAMTVIRRVTAHPTLAPSSGLRIARAQDGAAPLEVRAVHRPRPGDGVVERRGARLYLGPDAVRRLAGRELDAVTNQQGRVQFVLRAVA
jgi:Fe-S cluster assembly iron-binding protein IscA